MPDAAPDFRLYHSNALDVLASLLAHALRAPAPGQPLLAADTVLIPQVAMRRWLQSTLAAEYGIAANLEFLTPGEFVARALKANVPGEHDDLGAAGLHWRLYAALTDDTLMRQPAMAGLRAYLERDGGAGGDPLRCWALAAELGAVFEKYQAWRRDWLLRWEAGADHDDPQALLWRRIAAGRQHRARRINDYLARFEGASQPLPQGLPSRLFAFAALNVSPDVLRVIATQARVGTLHFYLPTPTRAWWGDLQTLSERLRGGVEDPFGSAAGENPLLQAWGAAGRDFMAVLGSYEVVHPSGEIAAYVDPELRDGPTLDQGGLRDSLLHRLQADLFHRRAAPLAPLRPALRLDDPSVQVHACHTRLREMQVLHDQLRALLDDPRFDPPLEPRQIAVLAPDIDPYVPYLESVFGGRGGGEEHIPWALADASPLQGEPLADVFVQLLGLPVSRFGRNEILDLLASPPLAAAAGLDAAAFERLHGWLQAAGARWGLDAAHRGQHQAPRDDACTWQFALDRLLLGHASGSDRDLAGVAPWPELEGGALAALDALVRLLRVLARHQKTLAEALPPAQWRQRLLGLLDALLPEPPADASTQRALERLRKLIHAFAEDAANAGFDAPVPAEAVRAHFAAVLSEADTRAPLLTGGVSFGRMVPMRLLPFRVICVLGLGDGDFPRRDPAAGLSRLTAELGSPRRRHGDRSLREDDRFLFLQLLASAQDVFYLSYLGADARDGSRREPSVLVSELIDAAAACHDDPPAARAALVVRHPLQPFVPAAFGGDGEPRRFSYRRQWHRAAAAVGGQRRVPAPWADAAAVAEPAAPAVEADLPLDALRRFLADPAGQYLAQHLGLRLPDDIEIGDDLEPLTLPSGGRDRSALQQQVLTALLEDDEDGLYTRLRARALLPSGAFGRQQFAGLLEQVRPCAERFAHWYDGAPLQSQTCDVVIDGVRVHGRIAQIHPQGLPRLQAGAPGVAWVLRSGLDWLLANAAGEGRALLQFVDDGHGDHGPHILPPVPAGQARDALKALMRLRSRGLQAPLPFAPYTGWAIYGAPPDKRMRAALEKWNGSERSWGEREGQALQLAFRGADPFASAATANSFIHNSLVVFTALREGRALEPGEVPA
ncbi:exodeoxyribonuclease V subunit gamma [Stenotrophomonas mori]|uniref:RecBCD enzyme subunit RecC n=1 Tax=Stenotrophomonas mori TaxID=2871096 RepID=A0ABT0SHK2_9GAMM|nr:exodeoxyribonuclease V subunit gamma [Stenotrophomonas mori]MCL7714813.1 exodeoxyribonuclease V subunit gamma [Stenotrophomonas mori]